MLRDEAISRAQTFVRSHYPIVPPVVMIQHVAKRCLEQREQLEVKADV